MAYWLLKTEAETFSWDDQVKRGSKGEPWTGVRNFTARGHLKAMKKGDLAFFYHTGDEKQVVGIAVLDETGALEPSAVVVCCRLMEYQWLPKRLKLNGAVCLESLSSEEVNKYLDSGGSKLAALRDAVNTDPVLQELALTPLMLSIMSLACQGAGGDGLASQKGGSLEERRKQIFGLYVEEMFKRKEMSSLVFPKEKVIGWLSWLAVTALWLGAAALMEAAVGEASLRQPHPQLLRQQPRMPR